MARVVVIASAEVDRETLAHVVSPDDELIVLVPAVKQSRLDWLANDEQEARQRARDVASQLERTAPTDVSAIEVKADAPEQLVADAIGQYRPDRIVLALRAGDDAAWLERDELATTPDQIEGVPVMRVAL